jgi:hypothetical protein
MANATANASPTALGGTGSATQAGAMGSSGGTTTGTVACSSCCAPQGRYLVRLFGGYGSTGLCPGAVDNSQPFPVYYTFVLTMNSPYTAAQFCLPSSFTLTATAYDLNSVNFGSSTCSTISPPATTGNVVVGSFSIQNAVYLLTYLCGCYPPFLAVGNNNFYSLVSCSPPVFSFSCNLVNHTTNTLIGTATVTMTF